MVIFEVLSLSIDVRHRGRGWDEPRQLPSRAVSSAMLTARGRHRCRRQRLQRERTVAWCYLPSPARRAGPLAVREDRLERDVDQGQFRLRGVRPLGLVTQAEIVGLL